MGITRDKDRIATLLDKYLECGILESGMARAYCLLTKIMKYFTDLITMKPEIFWGIK